MSGPPTVFDKVLLVLAVSALVVLVVALLLVRYLPGDPP
jgi:hypothetical protein